MAWIALRDQMRDGPGRSITTGHHLRQRPQVLVGWSGFGGVTTGWRRGSDAAILAQRPPCGGPKLPRENGPGAVWLDGDSASGLHDNCSPDPSSENMARPLSASAPSVVTASRSISSLAAFGFQEMRPVLALAFASLDAMTGINRADTASEIQYGNVAQTFGP